MRASAASRLGAYRRAIEMARTIVDALELREAPKGASKERLVQALRNVVDDQAVEWIDCALLLTSGGAAYPPLVGTGGTEGNLDFTSNFTQRLLVLFDLQTGAAQSNATAWLRASLFDHRTDRCLPDAIGQFFPGSAGGANAQSGFDAKPLVNPWDFVLMMEGTVVFAAAASRRMDPGGRGALSYSFTVRSAGVGYGSSASADEADARGRCGCRCGSVRRQRQSCGPFLRKAVHASGAVWRAPAWTSPGR